MFIFSLLKIDTKYILVLVLHIQCSTHQGLKIIQHMNNSHELKVHLSWSFDLLVSVNSCTANVNIDNVTFVSCCMGKSSWSIFIIKIFCLCNTVFNSPWPGDAILQHRSGSTLTQVMACCLTAPSHYLNQCWLVISGFCGIHVRAIFQEILLISICKMNLEIMILKLLLHLPARGNTP